MRHHHFPLHNTALARLLRVLLFLLFSLLPLANVVNARDDGSPPPPQSGQLTAGEIDDNLNFDYYVEYGILSSQRIGNQYLPNPDLTGRIPVTVVDENGNPYSGSAVQIGNDELPVGSNGKISLFPNSGFDDLDQGIQAKSTAGATCPEQCSEVAAAPSTPNESSSSTAPVQLRVPGTSTAPDALDLALIVDTTGSMCDELVYLQSELQDVVRQVTTAGGGDANVRVGYVAYRDAGDEYEVKTVGFTDPSDAVESFRREGCGGGGDFPEAMDRALEEAGNVLQWGTGGNVARVALVVADAPPHDENMTAALNAALRLRSLGVRVYGLAASGAADKAEYIMRLAAVLTGAWHMWLTDDSGIGNPHETPDVQCYKVQYLNDLLVRVLNTELTGVRQEASSSGVLREVGQQEGGICIVGMEPDDPPTPAPTSTRGEGGDGEGAEAAERADGDASDSDRGGEGATTEGEGEPSTSSAFSAVAVRRRCRGHFGIPTTTRGDEIPFVIGLLCGNLLVLFWRLIFVVVSCGCVCTILMK